MPLVLSPLVSCVFNTGITGCGFEIVGQGSEETKPEPCGHELFSDAGACILQGKRGQGARARNALGIWPTTSQPLSCTCTRLAWAPPWEQRLRLRQRQRRPQRRQPSRRRRKTGAREAEGRWRVHVEWPRPLRETLGEYGNNEIGNGFMVLFRRRSSQSTPRTRIPRSRKRAVEICENRSDLV